MKYAIRHPGKGWYCRHDFGGYEFSESVPAVLHYFASLEDAQAHFRRLQERDLLEIYYPVEKRGKRLFP